MTTFPARFPGPCAACGGRITPGDLIRPDEDEGGFVHADCPDLIPAKPPRPICPGCFTEYPVSGVCGVCE